MPQKGHSHGFHSPMQSPEHDLAPPEEAKTHSDEEMTQHPSEDENN